MFLGFANFQKQFIRSFNKIATLLILMLKITSSTSAQPGRTRIDKNKLNTNGSEGNGRVSGSKIDNKIVNLSSIAKKMSSKVSFLISKASLVFT